MMKKILYSFLYILILSGFLFGCSQTNDVVIKQLTADRLSLAESAEDLQQVSDLIIVYTPNSQENILSYFSDGNVSVGYTKTMGTVFQVLAGTVSVGDSILITEECYTTDSDSVLWTQGGYIPMKIGENYLLFLKAYSEESAYAGMYFPVDLEYGKYALSVISPMSVSNSYSAEQLEVGTFTDLDKYTEWYEAVRALYPNVF